MLLEGAVHGNGEASSIGWSVLFWGKTWQTHLSSQRGPTLVGDYKFVSYLPHGPAIFWPIWFSPLNSIGRMVRKAVKISNFRFTMIQHRSGYRLDRSMFGFCGLGFIPNWRFVLHFVVFFFGSRDFFISWSCGSMGNRFCMLPWNDEAYDTLNWRPSLMHVIACMVCWKIVNGCFRSSPESEARSDSVTQIKETFQWNELHSAMFCFCSW